MTWVLAQWVKGSRVAAAEVKFTAMAWIQCLAGELPYAEGVVKKKKKKKNHASEFYLFIHLCIN